jgi:4-amino-4-deoxy-L-arabinose transferase-like glycosyltransferase
MKSPDDHTTRILRFLTIAVAVIPIVVYFVVAAFRVGYSFQLEWMEGGILDHIQRIMDGKPLFVEPSLDFVPFIYTPLYYYLSAAVSLFVGQGFFGPRIVSIVASSGCIALIFALVRRETRDTVAGIVAAGLFAATYRAGGAWFDLARVDSLFVFFVLLAIYFLRSPRAMRSHILAAVFFGLAFFTKQVALIIAAPIVISGILLNRRLGLVLAGVFAFVVVGGSLVLNFVSDGWFSYYTFILPLGHELDFSSVYGFWIYDLATVLPVGILASAYFLRDRFEHGRNDFIFFFGVLAGTVIGAWFARIHAGSYENTLIPAHAGFSIVSGMCFARMKKQLELISSQGRLRRSIFVYLFCIAQFVLMSYDPTEQIPTNSDREAGETVVKRLVKVEGRVLVPRHGYLGELAGKTGTAHEMAMNDVLRGDEDGGGDKLRKEIAGVIRARSLGAIVVDYDWLRGDIEQFYKKRSELFDEADVFWPITGNRTRPEIIYQVE